MAFWHGIQHNAENAILDRQLSSAATQEHRFWNISLKPPVHEICVVGFKLRISYHSLLTLFRSLMLLHIIRQVHRIITKWKSYGVMTILICKGLSNLLKIVFLFFNSTYRCTWKVIITIDVITNSLIFISHYSTRTLFWYINQYQYQHYLYLN